MKNNLKVLMLSILFFGIVIFGIVGAQYWYNIDVQKCNDISESGNSYYYAENNCWKTYNWPAYTFIIMYITITAIPILLWIILLILVCLN